MFLPALHHHIYNSNPFGMGYFAMNPKINFLLGVACATSPVSMFAMPYSFSNPFLGSIFMQSPAFGFSNINTYSNPFNTLNNNFNINTPAVNNTFIYSGINTGIGSIPGTSGFPTIPPMPNFSMLPVPQIAPVKTTNTQSSSTIDDTEPQGMNLNKNKNEYGPAFLNKVKEIAKRLNCNYRDLLGIMNSESGINAKAKNPNSSATGLIQFIESTANGLGTTTAELANMSPIQQLDYVEKYIRNTKRMAGFSDTDKLSAGELYALIFLPARAKRDVITSLGERYYSGNDQLDKNKDGQITKDELGQIVKNSYVSDNSFLA